MSRHPHLVVQDLISGQEIDLASGSKLTAKALKGGKYRVVDKDSGKVAQNVEVGMDGSDLVIVVKEEQAALRLEGFKEQDGSFVASGADSEGRPIEQAVTAQELVDLTLGSGAENTAGAQDAQAAASHEALASLTMPLLFSAGLLAIIIGTDRDCPARLSLIHI